MTDWQKKNKNRLFIYNNLKTINHKQKTRTGKALRIYDTLKQQS